jgi:threonine/homoserine/homoserine lactone efflux protein
MREALFLGGGLALAAALQPGPLQAFLLASVAQRGWRRTLPAAFSPVLSDGPIALLVLLVLNHLPATLGHILQAAGGVFLLYLAWTAYRQWRAPTAAEPDPGSAAPRTLFQAATVNFLNPNPYLGWSLVLGPAVLRAWHQHPPEAVALVVAFYATMVTLLAATIVLFGLTGALGPSSRRNLILVSALMLAALGGYQLLAGLFRAEAVSRGGWVRSGSGCYMLLGECGGMASLSHESKARS